MKRFWATFLTILFAAAIVVLGAQELRHRYSTTRYSGDKRGRVNDMIRDMHGFDVRAKLSNEREHSVAPSTAEPLPPPPEKKKTDTLTRSDRKQLQDLIENLIPE